MNREHILTTAGFFGNAPVGVVASAYVTRDGSRQKPRSEWGLLTGAALDTVMNFAQVPGDQARAVRAAEERHGNTFTDSDAQVQFAVTRFGAVAHAAGDAWRGLVDFLKAQEPKPTEAGPDAPAFRR